MNKSIYEIPEMEVVSFDSNDIIITSDNNMLPPIGDDDYEE